MRLSGKSLGRLLCGQIPKSAPADKGGPGQEGGHLRAIHQYQLMRPSEEEKQEAGGRITRGKQELNPQLLPGAGPGGRRFTNCQKSLQFFMGLWPTREHEKLYAPSPQPSPPLGERE